MPINVNSTDTNDNKRKREMIGINNIQALLQSNSDILATATDNNGFFFCPTMAVMINKFRMSPSSPFLISCGSFPLRYSRSALLANDWIHPSSETIKLSKSILIELFCNYLG